MRVAVHLLSFNITFKAETSFTFEPCAHYVQDEWRKLSTPEKQQRPMAGGSTLSTVGSASANNSDNNLDRLSGASGASAATAISSPQQPQIEALRAAKLLGGTEVQARPRLESTTRFQSLIVCVKRNDTVLSI